VVAEFQINASILIPYGQIFVKEKMSPLVITARASFTKEQISAYEVIADKRFAQRQIAAIQLLQINYLASGEEG
jgi:hypothetical protein